MIAADGLRSDARALLGLVAACATPGTGPGAESPNQASVDVGGEAGETWGRGRIFGIAPLPDDRVYWLATDERGAVRERFGDWPPADPGVY